MNVQKYTPDRTWKNVWTILRSTNKSAIVLSCKECPQGVSPKSGHYSKTMGFLLYSLGYFTVLFFLNLFSVFEDSTASEGMIKTIRIILCALTSILCWVTVVPIIVFVSFRVSKWVPAQVSNENAVC